MLLLAVVWIPLFSKIKLRTSFRAPTHKQNKKGKKLLSIFRRKIRATVPGIKMLELNALTR
jgi:hypothetical protein